MKSAEIKALLLAQPLFKGLDETQLSSLASEAKVKSFRAGQYLAHEGESADAFYLLLDGRVEILTDAGAKKQVLQTIGPGEVFGWSWIVPPYRWNFDARAAVASRALVLAGQPLRVRCEEDPRFGYQLMKRFATIMVSRLRATRLQVLDVYGREPSAHR
ncbi:MAG: cyclic nucleotide-binding domain-containing protein [Bdellovibrionales bacterium]|nr:cyclic nucleotide-binding domain-containing protein [Bdellovibrionales bacterium]